MVTDVKIYTFHFLSRSADASSPSVVSAAAAGRPWHRGERAAVESSSCQSRERESGYNTLIWRAYIGMPVLLMPGFFSNRLTRCPLDTGVIVWAVCHALAFGR